MKISQEIKVGALIVGTLILCVVFALVIGVENPFKKSVGFYVTYNFAGGVEVGSPVRVSGIKVGKVERIDFFVPVSKSVQKIDETQDVVPQTMAHPTQEVVAHKEAGSADREAGLMIAPVRLKISVSKEAAQGVREDSHFYINMAGIIGERYVEITPGTMSSPEVLENDVMAGIDPPRIDQLLSQSFSVAEKIAKLLDENGGNLTQSLDMLVKLSSNLNTTLKWVDKSKLFKTDMSLLVNNLIQITDDVRKLTAKVDTPEGKRTLDLLHDLLFRLEPINEKTIRKFLQDEGVRARIF